VTPAEDRGRAFGMMQSTMMAGMLIGPAIGGFIALYNLSAVFVCRRACAPSQSWRSLCFRTCERSRCSKCPWRAAYRQEARADAGARRWYVIHDRVLRHHLPLYMTHRGANTFAVGLSFVAFALPATL